jgi:hypothetical protein
VIKYYFNSFSYKLNLEYFVGSKELLLEQRVPATYLALEDIVSHIGSERRQAGLDPVLNLDQFKTAVNAEMLSRYHKSFRDMAELNQAILFLHENGMLHKSIPYINHY